MKIRKIYTAGKMGGLSYEDQMDWRWQLEKQMRAMDADAIFIHPPQYYRYGESLHKTEREAMMWDLSQIRESDIVVVNLNNIADSIGTHMELGFIEALNQTGSKHIYVIGIGQANCNHPWFNEVLHRREDTVNDAANYICTYLLK